jgi:hypothetical protein
MTDPRIVSTGVGGSLLSLARHKNKTPPVGRPGGASGESWGVTPLKGGQKEGLRKEEKPQSKEPLADDKSIP